MRADGWCEDRSPDWASYSVGLGSKPDREMNDRAHEPVAPMPMPPDEVFEQAAAVFRVMSAPMRLKIINALCEGEKNVGELLAEVSTTQPNMSQHLATLYKAGVVGRRREGVHIFYRITDENLTGLCRAVCMHLTLGSRGDAS